MSLIFRISMNIIAKLKSTLLNSVFSGEWAEALYLHVWPLILYLYILAMPRVETRGSQNKKNNLNKEIETRSVLDRPLCCDEESVHSNHAGRIGHCDVTIAGGRLLYRWRHNRSTFWIIRSRDGIKCGFTSVKSQESHKWLVHRIHRVRNIG